ncbi:MAG: hypothetical protein IPK52_21390 [Chloroflexi bacterium]|nr:hypothetical protein [Chloroflexota bacterium]
MTSSRRLRKLLPAGFFLVAAVLLVVSIGFPYWGWCWKRRNIPRAGNARLRQLYDR